MSKKVFVVTSGYLNIDLQKHVEAKMNYNKDRGYLHGKLY
jgi:hypothetical protein